MAIPARTSLFGHSTCTCMPLSVSIFVSCQLPLWPSSLPPATVTPGATAAMGAKKTMKSGAKDSKLTKAEPKAKAKTRATKTKAQKKPAAVATAPGIGPLGLVPLEPLDPRPESAEPEPGTVTGLPEVDQVGHGYPIGGHLILRCQGCTRSQIFLHRVYTLTHCTQCGTHWLQSLRGQAASTQRPGLQACAIGLQVVFF